MQAGRQAGRQACMYTALLTLSAIPAKAQPASQSDPHEVLGPCQVDGRPLAAADSRHIVLQIS